MKVLVIGRGVVGTIYGWALSKAGIDVTHVVRKEGLPDTDTLDLLDLRPGYPKNTRVSYAPKTVAQISPSDGFDLVVVATQHYQAAQASHTSESVSARAMLGRTPYRAPLDRRSKVRS